MMDVKEFLYLLNEDKKIFKIEELIPVIISDEDVERDSDSEQASKQEVEVISVKKSNKEKKSEIKDGKGESGGEEGKSSGDSKSAGEKQDNEKSKDSESKEGKKQDDKLSKADTFSGNTVDSHKILEKGNKEAAKDLAEKIIKDAESRREKEGRTSNWGDKSENYMEKLKEIYKPKIDWVRELKKKINDFKSVTSKSIDKLKTTGYKFVEGEGSAKSKSYFQWLRDPRSHSSSGDKGTLIFKGPSVKAPVTEAVLIIALDTSGSIPEDTIAKTFSELDSIAKNFTTGVFYGANKITGRCYFMMWDTEVKLVEEYKHGGWRRYKEKDSDKGIIGGGGTKVSSVFNYISDHFVHDKESKSKFGVLNLIEKPSLNKKLSKNDIIIPTNSEGVPKVSPFLIIVTDGYFDKPTDLGIVFKENKDNILYLIINGTTSNCYPENIIKYDEYKI